MDRGDLDGVGEVVQDREEDGFEFESCVGGRSDRTYWLWVRMTKKEH